MRITALAEHALGHAAEADDALAALIKDHHADDAFGIAANFASMGRIDEAFAWMDKVVAQRDAGLVLGLRGDPLFANLRSDPRWPRYIEAMRLPD